MARTAVCLTGLWRAGSDLDRCREQYLRTCVPNPTLFRIDSIRKPDGSRVSRQQWRQILQCKERINEHERSAGVRFSRVLRTRPDVITYPISLANLPNRPELVFTYGCFWRRKACAKVKLNDVHMSFSRATFEALFTHDEAPVTAREGRERCDFTGAVKDYQSFECWCVCGGGSLCSSRLSAGVCVGGGGLFAPLFAHPLFTL